MMPISPSSRDGRVLIALAAVAALTFASGCATRTGSFGGRFVTPGEPTVSFDAAPGKPQEAGSLGDFVRRLRTVQANARTNVTLGATIESHDPALASALLRVSVAPTAANHRLAAEAYRNAGITDYAYKHLRRALQVQPCDSAALEGLAQLWRGWHAPELALADAHRAVYCAPASASAHNTLGTVLLSLGQVTSARRAFEFALRLDPTAAFAQNNLCYAALQEGDGASAEAACERALTLDPTLVAAQTNLALAYAIQGRVAQAEGRLQARADAAIGLYNVGVLRLSLRQFGEAAEAFDLAAAARPSLADAARRAAQARSRAAGQKE
jgi:Flp pilus assembly protein TadD